MTLDKDQLPVLKGMIKASYSPVLKRAMINSFLLGLQQVRQQFFFNADEAFMNMLHAPEGFKVSKEILKKIDIAREAMIVELMKQYGIDKDQGEFEIYMDELDHHFDKHLANIEDLAYHKRFQQLARLTQVME